MRGDPFYITFVGAPERFPPLRRFFEELKAEKDARPYPALAEEDVERLIADPKWIDLLDRETLERMTDGRNWPLEDLLDCILSAEYHLVDITLGDDFRGTLRYDPLAYPFGGTEPLHGLLEAFGFFPKLDSFYDRIRV